MGKIEVNINGIPVPEKKDKEQELLKKMRERRHKFETGKVYEAPTCEAMAKKEEILGDIVNAVKKRAVTRRDIEEAKSQIAKTREALSKVFPAKETVSINDAHRIVEEYQKLNEQVNEFAKAHKGFPRFILDGYCLGKFPEQDKDTPLGERLHKQICDQLHETYKKKNADYGDSFTKLYEKLGMTAAQTFLEIKWNRFQTLLEKDPEVVTESIDDTLLDLANYCILTLVERKKGGK